MQILSRSLMADKLFFLFKSFIDRVSLQMSFCLVSLVLHIVRALRGDIITNVVSLEPEPG